MEDEFGPIEAPQKHHHSERIAQEASRSQHIFATGCNISKITLNADTYWLRREHFEQGWTCPGLVSVFFEQCLL